MATTYKSVETRTKMIWSSSKVYPDKIRIFKFYRPFVVFESITKEVVNGELVKETHTLPELDLNEEKELEHISDYITKSINRTKTKISDYVLCNDFSHFATFTFDAKNPKVGCEENRYNFDFMADLLKNWLKTEQTNHQRRHGFKFKYLIVPERHKNGAWHFHALLENYQNETANFYSSKNPYITVKELKTAKRYKNREFLTRYNLGRSEIAPIRDKTKMSNYIKKYITKELITEPNAKRYWSSRNLEKPLVIHNILDERARIPEEFKEVAHDYFEVYDVPFDSDYFGFLLTVFTIDRNETVQRSLTVPVCLN